MAGLVLCRGQQPLSSRPARRRPVRRGGHAAGDLVRRRRAAADGQRRADRDVGAAVRGLGAVRGHRGARRGRERRRRDRRRDPAQPPLRADGHRIGAVAARRAASPGAHRPGDDRLLVGGGEPRRRALRPRLHARRDRAGLSMLGPRHRRRRVRGRPDRRPRGARARRDLPGLLPLPAGRGRAAPRPAGGRRRARRPDRARPDPVHTCRGAGDRGLGRRPARAARRPRRAAGGQGAPG